MLPAAVVISTYLNGSIPGSYLVGLVRISVGMEDIEDLIDDVAQAFEWERYSC
jgi:hypothetical protein